MNWKTTWTLAGLALGLFAFIMLFERHTTATGEGGQPLPRLLPVQSSEVSGIQLRRSDQLLLDVTRTNGTWKLSFPMAYPAQAFALDGLLQDLTKLQPSTTLDSGEIKSSGGLEEFGLAVPVASLILRHAQGREELFFGSKTPVGDEVYIRVAGRPRVYTVDAQWYDRLPESPHDWRDRALIQAEGLKWDRLEVRTPNRGYAIRFDPTNQVFYLSKPATARAAQHKVQDLMQAIFAARVRAFVEDNPRADLERYGLQTPAMELVFGVGTNDNVTVQFGGRPANDTNAVYALRLAHTNIVLVDRELVEALQVSHAEMRERHLLTFDPGAVDQVRIAGTTNLLIRRDGAGGWEAAEPRAMAVDSDLMRFFFRLLSRLEGDMERDVATDLAAYGLATPTARYTLESFSTNAAGITTNRVMAEVDFGAQQEGKIYARRTDEQSVYTVDLAAVEQLPVAAWQLRNLRVWSFSTNEVRRVTVRLPGGTETLLRQGPGNWALGPGSQGVINDLAVEETIHRLGQLRAEFWVARGEERLSRFGFREDGSKLTVELQRDGGTETVELEFGDASTDQYTYAMTRLEGEPVVFEFPKKLHFELVRDLMLPFMNRRGANPL